MIRILVLALLLFTANHGWAQSQPPKRSVPAQVQSGDNGKKVGISSAARRSSLPAVAQPGAKPNGDPNQPNQMGGKKPGHPGGMDPNRPHVRGVPKTRPGGPITRPGGMPGQRPPGPRLRPPGN
ncbi:hypothetical protein D0X99_14390 [Algoriphagus lacus]|uniref:Translation initiation factor IF-2 n=1 Tax=Algoriphagus lacus TaxID=2056311 RepID=A0A418PPK6_9BACT|nr:hypothetical protein [Algoriphagus lacus]RIW13996.1 hypothetical protein D0X99_14390 [Algoriphagus lacus]